MREGSFVRLSVAARCRRAHHHHSERSIKHQSTFRPLPRDFGVECIRGIFFSSPSGATYHDLYGCKSRQLTFLKCFVPILKGVLKASMLSQYSFHIHLRRIQICTQGRTSNLTVIEVANRLDGGEGLAVGKVRLLMLLVAQWDWIVRAMLRKLSGNTSRTNA